MKILMIDNSKGWGGAEQLLLSLAVELRTCGHYVGLQLREGSVCVDKFTCAGFDVWAYPGKSFGRLQGIIKIIGITRNKNFDLIHVHRNHDLFAGKIVGLFSGQLPLVLTQHCWLGATSFPIINLPDRIVTVSKFIADGIVGRFPSLGDKTGVIYNGIKFSDFDQTNDEYWSGRPELAGKGPLLGVVGYFYKNQVELIELLPRLKPFFPNLALIIIGRDDQRKDLLEEKAVEFGVTDSVFFAGEIPHEEMGNALAGLDINISAFRNEGFGLAVVEGMAVGTPFVGYRAGGYEEIINQGENGYLAENQGEFVEIIIKLLGDKEKLNLLGARARADVRQRFSVDTMLMHYELLYTELLKEKILL